MHSLEAGEQNVSTVYVVRIAVINSLAKQRRISSKRIPL